LSTHKGTGFATTGVRTLQETGIIDVYWEYTGTSLTTFNQVTEKLSPDEAYARAEAGDRVDSQDGGRRIGPDNQNSRAQSLPEGVRKTPEKAAEIPMGATKLAHPRIVISDECGKPGLDRLPHLYVRQYGDCQPLFHLALACAGC